jgi:hypothetical protein
VVDLEVTVGKLRTHSKSAFLPDQIGAEGRLQGEKMLKKPEKELVKEPVKAEPTKEEIIKEEPVKI